jgi:hypothetical protein
MREDGSVGVAPVLDIGGEVGALVVHLAAVPASGELEACPAGRLDRRFHTGVHPREIRGRDSAVAVFPQVVAGEYDVLDEGLRVIARARVDGGTVTEVRLTPSQ